MGEVTLIPPAPVATTPPGGPGPRAHRWRDRLARLYWAAPALVTLGLGLWDARRPALWADELATWGAVRLSWGELWRLLGNVDATVGPYYLGLKLWTGFAGTGNLALRLPSIVAMAATAALVAVLGARLATWPRSPRLRSPAQARTAPAGPARPTATRRPLSWLTSGPDQAGDRLPPRLLGLLAGLLFAAVPATSRFAQEARPYAFSLLFACLATLALAWLLDRPGWLRAVAYALCVVALGAAHLLAVMLLAAHAVAVAGTRHRPSGRRALIAWAGAATAALLLLLPLAALGARQRGQVAWIPPVTWDALLSVPDTIFATSAVGGAVVVLALLATRRRPPEVLLLAWAVVPALVLFAVAQLQALFWARYLLFTLPAWVLLAARTLTRVRLARAVAVLLVVAGLGVATQQDIRKPAGHNHATAAAGAIIAVNEQPGDALVVALHESPEPWEARDIVARYVPADRRPLDLLALVPQRVDGHLLATEPADPAPVLDSVDPPRIWIIRFEARPDPLTGIGAAKEQALRSRYHLDRLWLVRGLTVALLVRN